MNLLVWVVSLGVSLGLFLVLFIWRTVARRSAILFTDEALIWLDKGTVAYIAWSEMSFDSFGKALTGARATQGVMNFESSTGIKGLTIYTPYMCIDYSRRFTAEILMRLKAAEESEA